MKPRQFHHPLNTKVFVTLPRSTALAGVVAVTLGIPAQAATDLWTGAVNGNWNTTDANWNNGGTNLYTSGDIVQFGDAGGANLTISVAAAVTPASVSFTDTGAGTNAYTFNGSGINGTGTTVSLNSGFGGSVRFNVTNGYTGGTTITSGTLQVANSAALGTGAITLAGGSLQSAGSGTKTLANTSIVATASTTTSLASVGGDLVLSGALTGSGNISINNATAGSFKLSGNLSGYTGTISYNNVVGGNNFFVAGGAGGTDLSNAKLVLSGSTAIGSRRFGGDTATAGIVQIGELSGQGVIGASNNGNTTYQIGKLNTDSTLNATFIDVGSGVASITKVGTGTLALGGANTNTGAYTVNAGTLKFTNGQSLYNSAATLNANVTVAGKITVESGATLALNVDSATASATTGFTASEVQTIAALGTATTGFKTGSILGLDTSTATGGTFTYSNVLANTNAGANVLGLTKLGTGILSLTNTNTFTGGTNVNAGTLALAHATNTLADAGSVNVNNGSTLDIAGNNDTVGIVTLNNGSITGTTGILTGSSYAVQSGSVTAILGGSGTLTKTTAGTVTLSGVNTYTGLTTIDGGTLSLATGSSLASAVTVNTGGKLTGSGSVAGATTIQSGGKHSAGDPAVAAGVGSQAFSSTLNYANGSIFEWDLNASSTASGFDTVSAAGNIDVGTTDTVFKVIFGATATADIQNTENTFWNTPYGTQTWTMASIFGEAFNSGAFQSVQTSFDVSNYGSFTINGSTLTWSAVPEPTSALAGLLLGAGLLRRRRKI